MLLALSTLCEDPRRRTGLTTFFHRFVESSVELYSDVFWIVFAHRDGWSLTHPRVRVVRSLPAGNLSARLVSDHVLFPIAARALGADALVTVGFVPILKTLPTAMHMLVLTQLNGLSDLGKLRHRYRRLMTESGLKRAELLITNSNWAAAKLRAAKPNCGDRLIISYEGLQHDLFQPEKSTDEEHRLQEAFDLQPGYLLWVSNLYPYKQIDLLLKGYALLPRARRNAAPLVVVGGSWGQSDSAKALAERLGILDDVRILGWTADEWLPILYRNAGAMALASREETFGRCVIEAMGCGVPCVVNDIPVMREVTSGNALLVDYADSAAVATALERALTDEAVRKDLRSRGLERARHFRFDRLAAERIDAVRKRCARRQRVNPGDLVASSEAERL
jgi:glycosyltransferase involved in cell wall biosynthesis